MSIYNTYRPSTLQNIKGNREVIKSLQALTSNKESIQTFLFTGPRGCGKTTLSRIVANNRGCDELDIMEVNCANDTGVDPIRNIIRQMRNKPLNGKCRAWILDEVHCLTSNAQSALLKPLEEPPEHVLFFLCTTEPQKLKDTIHSRCMSFKVEPLTERQMVMLLSEVCTKEKKKVPKEVLNQIAQDSLGYPRDALVILEKIINMSEDDMLNAAKKAAEQTNAIIDLCRSLWNKRPWKEITSIINNLNDDPETIRRSILGYCDSILAKGDNPSAYLVMDRMREPVFHTGKPGIRIACYEVLIDIKERK